MCASFSSWFLFANHLSSRFSSIYLMIKSINQSTYDVPSLSKYNKSLSLCSWKRPWAIWGDSCNLICHPNGQDGPILLGWDRPSWSRARKRLRGADLPSSWFFYNVGNEVAKQRRKNKTFKDSYGFTIVLQIQFGFFPGSRNKQKQVILDSYYIEIFCCINNPSMTKLVRSR